MTDTLTILTETAPLVLSLLILGAILGVFIYAISRILVVLVPVLTTIGNNAHAQQEAWGNIVTQQEAANKRLIEALERELKDERKARENLEKIVSELRDTLDRQDKKLNKQEVMLKKMSEDNIKLTEDNKKLLDRVRELESKGTPGNGNKTKQDASDKK